MKLSNKLSISFTLAPLLFTYSQNISTKPNVIIIYTDDQGAIDLNCYGAKDLVTPNMDKLVSKGVKFTQFYGAPISSPSKGRRSGKCKCFKFRSRNGSKTIYHRRNVPGQWI